MDAICQPNKRRAVRSPVCIKIPAAESCGDYLREVYVPRQIEALFLAVAIVVIGSRIFPLPARSSTSFCDALR